MLTNLTPQRPQLLKKSFSPPSRALANYAKASGDGVMKSLDSVELSELAKSKTPSTSSLRKLGTFVTIGLAFVGVMGATGCSAGAAAGGTATARPETESVQDSLRQQDAKIELQRSQVRDTIGSAQRLHPDLRGKTAEEIAESIGQGGRQAGRHIVDGLKEGTENLKDLVKDKDAEEIAESIGEEGRRLGQQLGQEGKKVGQEAAKIGKEVGNVAKGFWRGLTGKGKK